MAFPLGSLAHYRVLEWLNFIATEIHKTLGALFNPTLPPTSKDAQLLLFGRRCDWLAKTLGDSPFLMGQDYTIADAYLFTVLNWTPVLNVDMGHWPSLCDYLARIAERPAVQATLAAEGLGFD